MIVTSRHDLIAIMIAKSVPPALVIKTSTALNRWLVGFAKWAE